MKGILNKQDDKWVITYEEHFRTVKDTNGIFTHQETITKTIPILNPEAKKLTDDLVGREIEFTITYDCPFEFTSRCTLGRCDCEEIASKLIY